MKMPSVTAAAINLNFECTNLNIEWIILNIESMKLNIELCTRILME